MKRIFLLKGLDCPNCSAKIEKEVGELDGVQSSVVNLMKQTLTINVAPAAANTIASQIETIVFSHEPGVEVQEETIIPVTKSYLLKGLDCPNCSAKIENDNAETVLMNLMRGASLEGLKGIEPIRGKFIRPLIECSRDKIEAYCEENKLDPKFDKTNNDNIYTRNKIRNLLIPYIKKEFNPNIVESLNRLAVLARQDAKYFSEIVKNEYKNLVIFENVNKETHNIIDKNTNIGTNQEENASQKNGNITELNDINKTNIKKTVEQQIILDLKKFNKLEYVIKSRVLLYTINKLLGTTKGIEKINVEDMIKLCEKNIGNKYLIPNKNVKIFIKKGKVFFIKL